MHLRIRVCVSVCVCVCVWMLQEPICHCPRDGGIHPDMFPPLYQLHLRTCVCLCVNAAGTSLPPLVPWWTSGTIPAQNLLTLLRGDLTPSPRHALTRYVRVCVCVCERGSIVRLSYRYACAQHACAQCTYCNNPYWQLTHTDMCTYWLRQSILTADKSRYACAHTATIHTGS